MNPNPAKDPLRPPHSQRSLRREGILEAALPRFAERGYAGTSIRELAAAAGVTNPVLYYHFGSKAGLFRVLVDRAQDAFLRRITAATEHGSGLPGQLVELCAAWFDLAVHSRATIRVALGQTFLNPGELPPEAQCAPQAHRVFAAIQRVMQRGLDQGSFGRRWHSDQLTLAYWGMVHAQIMAHLANARHVLSRRAAEEVVALFLKGAAATAPAPAPHRPER